MRDYSYAELGMLAGTVLGTVASITAFSLTGRILYFIIAAVGAAAGITAGYIIDRRLLQRK